MQFVLSMVYLLHSLFTMMKFAALTLSLAISLCLSKGHAQADEIQRVVDAWVQKQSDHIDESFNKMLVEGIDLAPDLHRLAMLHGPTQRRISYKLAISATVSELADGLEIKLIREGLLTTQNGAELALTIDNAKEKLLERIHPLFLEDILKDWADFGNSERVFRGIALPPTQILAMIRKRLGLSECSTVLAFKGKPKEGKDK